MTQSGSLACAPLGNSVLALKMRVQDLSRVRLRVLYPSVRSDPLRSKFSLEDRYVHCRKLDEF